MYNLYQELLTLQDNVSNFRKDIYQKARKKDSHNSKGICMALFLQEVEKKCIFSLYSLINKEKERLVVELLKGSSYWDHFSMSIMFLIMLKVCDFNNEFAN